MPEASTPTSPEILLRGPQNRLWPARCQNPECGSTSLAEYENTLHYRALLCRGCGQFVVEGKVSLFVQVENLRRQRDAGDKVATLLLQQAEQLGLI